MPSPIRQAIRRAIGLPGDFPINPQEGGGVRHNLILNAKNLTLNGKNLILRA